MSANVVSIRQFTRDFARLKDRELSITDRGETVGHYIPTARHIEKVDFLARQKECGFTKPLPFTGTELLKKGKKR